MTNVKRFEVWLHDAADEQDQADRQALRTGMALVWFYREVMRIMHDETPMSRVAQEIIDSVFEAKETDPIGQCDCAVCEQE